MQSEITRQEPHAYAPATPRLAPASLPTPPAASRRGSSAEPMRSCLPRHHKNASNHRKNRPSQRRARTLPKKRAAPLPLAHSLPQRSRREHSRRSAHAAPYSDSAMAPLSYVEPRAVTCKEHVRPHFASARRKRHKRRAIVWPRSYLCGSISRAAEAVVMSSPIDTAAMDRSSYAHK